MEDLKSQHPDKQVQVLSGDLNDFSIAKEAVELALSKWGKLDGMVLNHGVLGPLDRIAIKDPNNWRSGSDINLISMTAFACYTLPVVSMDIALTWSRSQQLYHPSVPPKVVMFSHHLVLPRRKLFTGWGAYECSEAAAEHLA